MIICPICFIFYKVDDDLAILKCGHSYHKSCILTWFESPESGRKCPACRKKHTGKLNPVFLQFEADTRERASAELSPGPPQCNLDSLKKEVTSALAVQFKKCASSTSDCNVEELLKKVNLENVEAQFNDLKRQLSEQKDLVSKSQGEVTQLRNLGSEKDNKIGAMTNQIHSANAALRHNREEYNKLQLAADSLRKGNGMLRKRNSFLETENRSLQKLRPLKPIKQLLDGKYDELSKRVESFRKLADTHEDPVQLLVNYCVLVDCEVQDEIKKSEALKRQLKHLIKVKSSTCVKADGDNGATGFAPNASLIPSSSKSSAAAIEQMLKTEDDSSETSSTTTPCLVSQLDAANTTDKRPKEAVADAESAELADPGCSFWSTAILPRRTGGQGRKEAEQEEDEDAAVDQDDVVVSESLPPILNTRNRKHAVIQAPATTNNLIQFSGDLDEDDDFDIDNLCSLDDLNSTYSSTSSSSDYVPNMTDDESQIGDQIGATSRALKRTFSRRANGAGSRTRRRGGRRTRTSNNTQRDVTNDEDDDATIIDSHHSTVSAAVSLGSSAVSIGPSADAASSRSGNGSLRKKRRKFESGGTTFQIVDEELSIEAPEVVSLLSDDEDEDEKQDIGVEDEE